MSRNPASKTNRLVGTAILAGVIVVLQIIATYIKFGPFSITLALVPIVVGAAIYGAGAGALFGGIFGVVVLIGCIGGADAGGNILWNVNPALTAFLCIFKGAAAGWVSGLVYSAFSRRNTYAGVFSAAVVCPIVNTGIFIAAMMLLFRDTLIQWAGDTSVVYYAFIGLTGVNFLLEFAVNIVLSSAVVRIINTVARR
ncbi:MAG: ECF transporter S component [Oscillospiraceae bacterium]|nr:ECF transporter S component [Oscillospiraceae bacterium]